MAVEQYFLGRLLLAEGTSRHPCTYTESEMGSIGNIGASIVFNHCAGSVSLCRSL